MATLLILDAAGMFAVPLLAGPRDATIDTAAVRFLKDHTGLQRFYTLGRTGRTTAPSSKPPSSTMNICRCRRLGHPISQPSSTLRQRHHVPRQRAPQAPITRPN